MTFESRGTTLTCSRATQTGPISHLSTLLPPLFSSVSTIYTDITFAPASNKPSTSLFTRFLSTLKSSPSSPSSSSTTEKSLSSILASRSLRPLKSLVHDLRAYKSENEIQLMRRIGQATGRTFQGVMSRDWKYESEIEAWMEYDFRKRGMDGSAYVPVVAGGRVRVWISHFEEAAWLADIFSWVRTHKAYTTRVTTLLFRTSCSSTSLFPLSLFNCSRAKSYYLLE